MTLIRILKLLANNLVILILFPISVAVIVFFLNKNKPQEYQSGMILNTGIASGFNLSSLNSNRIDYFAVNNAFDNLTAIIQSRETLEELAINLLSSHIAENDEYKEYINAETYSNLKNELLGPDLYEELVSLRTKEKIRARLEEMYYDIEFNKVKEVIQKKSTHYNIDGIRGDLQITRKASSDMLEVIYKSSDPGVCFQTLDQLAKIFIKKYSASRNYEAGGIIDYFFEELEKAKNKLNTAEENLKNYSQQNQIINYEEQTKFIAEAKEELERDIYRTRMDIESSESALKEINQKLDNQGRRYLNSESILESRKKLSDLNTEITSLSIRSQEDYKERLDSILVVQDKLRETIAQNAKDFYTSNYSSEVIPRLTILSEFLKHTLDLDMGKARLQVLQEHREYFDKLFDEFAPVGFNLSKMEREIQIAEQEYLSILHGLNQAKIQKSNSELFGNLELLDRPFFPINPKSSKTLLLVVGGAFVSLFFVLAVIFGKEFLNRAIRSPTLIHSVTGLDLVGALPHEIKNKKIDKTKLNNKLQNLLVNNLAIALKGSPSPPMIFLIATRSQNNLAKSGLFVAESLQKINNQLVYYYFLDDHNKAEHLTIKEASSKVILREYDPKSQDILEDIHSQQAKNFGMVIQVPEFENSILYKLSNLDPSCIILIVNANQGWGFHDKTTLNLIKKIFSDTSIYVFGADMDPEFMEEIISEVPKERSNLRKWTKSLITLNK